MKHRVSLRIFWDNAFNILNSRKNDTYDLFCLHLRRDSLNSKPIFKALNLKYFKFVSCRFIRATTKTLLIGLVITGETRILTKLFAIVNISWRNVFRLFYDNNFFAWLQLRQSIDDEVIVSLCNNELHGKSIRKSSLTLSGILRPRSEQYWMCILEILFLRRISLRKLRTQGKQRF